MNRRAIYAWAMYDWANSVFSVTVISAFFPLFLKQYWSSGNDATVSTFQLGVANAMGGIVVALLSPMLGAIADQGGTRKLFLGVFTALAVATTAGLAFVARGEWQWAIALYAIAGIGFSGATAFYDALIVDVAKPSKLHQVSALGFGLGYLGECSADVDGSGAPAFRSGPRDWRRQRPVDLEGARPIPIRLEQTTERRWKAMARNLQERAR